MPTTILLCMILFLAGCPAVCGDIHLYTPPVIPSLDDPRAAAPSERTK